jgi:hypothetical protein
MPNDQSSPGSRNIVINGIDPDMVIIRANDICDCYSISVGTFEIARNFERFAVKSKYRVSLEIKRSIYNSREYRKCEYMNGLIVSVLIQLKSSLRSAFIC